MKFFAIAFLLIACSRPKINAVKHNAGYLVPAIGKDVQLLDSWKTFTILGGDSIAFTSAKGTDLHNPASGAFRRHSAPKLLFATSDTFELSAKLMPDFNGRYNGAAILLYTDTLRWAKMLFQNTGNGRIIGMSVVREGQTDDSYFNISDSSSIYMRLKKAGPVCSFYVSSNGADWKLTRQFVYSQPAKAGFYVQSPLADSCRTIFSQIVYKEGKG
jgi:uncharacterized protein